MKKYMMKSLLILVGLWTVLALPSYAQVPQKINYQGILSDSSGNPINDTVQMTFAIYDQADGGAPLWSESLSVDVEFGKYSVILGKIYPIDLSDAKPYWLGITVAPDTEEMTPRVEMTSVMYSLFPEGAVGPGECTCDITLEQFEALTAKILALEVQTEGICVDNDNDGYGFGGKCLGLDCDDSNPGVYPRWFEQCDGIDDNCDGQIDEGCIEGDTCKNPNIILAEHFEWFLNTPIPADTTGLSDSVFLAPNSICSETSGAGSPDYIWKIRPPTSSGTYRFIVTPEDTNSGGVVYLTVECNVYSLSLPMTTTKCTNQRNQANEFILETSGWQGYLIVDGWPAGSAFTLEIQEIQN